MSILAKLSRLTLTAPPPPDAAALPPNRVYITTEQVPLYREYTVPLSDAGPGDRIVDLLANYFDAERNIFPGKLLGRVAVRRILAGYTTIKKTVVEPAPRTIVNPDAPVVTPVPPAWDATAWSIDAVRAPLEATWEVGAFTAGPAGGGALVGLAITTPEPGTELQSIVHGIKVEQGIAYAHTAPPGGVEPAPGAGQVLAPFVPVIAGQQLKIIVAGGQVRMYANGTLLAVQPSYLGAQPARLAAVLYDPLDTVENAAIGPFESGSGAAAFKIAARGAAYNYAEGRAQIRLTASGAANKNFLRLSVYAKGSDRQQQGNVQVRVVAEGFANYVGRGTGTAVIGPIVARGASYKYATGGVFFVLAASGTGGPPTTNLFGRTVSGGQFLESTATFPHRGFYARAGAVGSFTATVRRNEQMPERIAAQGEFKAARVYMLDLLTRAGLRVAHKTERVLDVVLVGGAGAGAPLSGVMVLTGALQGAAAVAGTLSGSNTINAQLQGAAGVTGGFAPTQLLHAALAAIARAGVLVHMPGSNLAVWAVNMDTGGSTAYEAYPFNSFARIGGRYYGAAEGGVFELDGDTDNEAPIEAYMNLGRRSFGTNVLKGISHAYLTTSGEGHMLLRVTTPKGEQYTYRTRRAAEDVMAVERVDLGRGLRAHFLNLELMNEGGADFELERAEFLVTELNRRI